MDGRASNSACAKCGSPVPLTAGFCPQCGNPVAAATAAATILPAAPTMLPTSAVDGATTDTTGTSRRRRGRWPTRRR